MSNTKHIELGRVYQCVDCQNKTYNKVRCAPCQNRFIAAQPGVCGACARIGTNDIRRMAHAPGCAADDADDIDAAIRGRKDC